MATAGREVRRVRSDALQKFNGGLRAVYRTLELPGKNLLTAYGFSPKRDLLAQLHALNHDFAARIDAANRSLPLAFPIPTVMLRG